VQYLSAGSGIVHSEMNDHTADTTRFLQIWLTPDKRGVKPQVWHWHRRKAMNVLCTAPVPVC
jgi:redox-sensitive bicupin YhaK (pirin superfamily)